VLRRSDGNRFLCDRRRDDIAANDLNSACRELQRLPRNEAPRGGNACLTKSSAENAYVLAQNQRGLPAGHNLVL